MPEQLSDEMILDLLNESMRITMCVKQARWCCSYHEGFEDALGLAQQRLADVTTSSSDVPTP